MNIITKLTLVTILINSFTPLRPAMDQSDDKLTAEQLQEKVVQKALDNALLNAINTNDLKKAQAALFEGADPDAPYPDALHPETASLFSHAVVHSNSPMIELLIDAGAQLNLLVKNAEYAPLRIAVHDACPQAVVLLINAKAQVNVQDNKGITSLMYAVHSGFFGSQRQVASSYPILCALLDAGADYQLINSNNHSAYSYAESLPITPTKKSKFFTALETYKRGLNRRKQGIKYGICPHFTLDLCFDYLVKGPLSITPLCNLFVEYYVEHFWQYTPEEATQRSAEANSRQKQIKRERMEAAARRRAEARLAAHAAEIAQQKNSGKQ
jgi:hypothetical protein